MAILGTVVSINGSADAVDKVFVIKANGEKAVLQLNDTIAPGDTIVTPRGVIVDLMLINDKALAIFAEQSVQITQELVDSVPPSTGDSAIDQATIQAVITAINEGRDISDVLEETAAGIEGGATADGHGFVDLSRVIESVNPTGFDFRSSRGEEVTIEPLFEESNDLNSFIGVGANTDTTAPIPTITLSGITADNILNAAEAGGPVAVTGTVGGEFNPGDTVTLTVNGNPYTGIVGAGGTFSINVPGADLVADPDTTVDASIATTDAAGNPGTGTASQAYVVDTTAPTAPVVTITEDANNDGIINSAELSGAVDVSVALPGDAVAGDSITITDGVAPVTIVLTAGQITAGVVTATFTAPASGSTLTVTAAITDIAGNLGASGSDAAVIATTSPIITINTIAGDDIINALEDDSPVVISGSTANVENGQTVTVIVNGITYTTTVTANAWTLSMPAVDAQALATSENVTADVSDLGGNPAPQATRTVTHDDSPPAAPVVTITEDANDDGLINSAELSGAVDVSVALPGDAVAGDSITITDGTTPVTIVLTAGQITAGVVTTTFTAPASGSTLTVTAAVTDIAGNVGASGSDAATIDTSAPAAPVVTITEDANDDGLINSAELSGAVDVSVALPGDAVAGDSITITDGTTPVTIVLTAGQITAGVVTTTFTAPASGSTLTVTAAVTDIAGNVGASGSDAATIDTSAPAAPVVTITEDANDDGLINSAELSGAVDVSVALPGDAVAGDSITITDGTTPVTIVLTAGQITAGVVTTTFTAPASGSTLTVTAAVTDIAGNVGASGSDAATIDTSAPAAPVVTITEDANDDGLINSAELSGAVDVSVALPGDAVAGDSITITDGTTPVTIVLTAGQITAGVVTTTFTAPASGSTLTVTAAVTDIAGNVGASGSDAATIDTSAPAAPVVTITEDANDDGLINSAELSGAVDVSVALPGDAVAGDSITITDGTTPVTIVLTAGQITAGVVTTTFTAPASGSTLTVTAAVTDIAGNVGASGSDAATIDTSAPAAPVVTITEDANDDGLINSAELSGAVDVSVALPGDAVAGDSITITDGTTPVTIVLTAGQITAGVVTTTFTAPASGSTLTVTAAVTDIAGNVGASGSDAATIDTSAPAAPVVTITEDANDDGLINSAELSGAVDVSVALPGDAVAGDSITITDGTTPVTIVLTAGQITAGVVTTTFTAPASGSTLTVTAAVTDIAGNVGASGSDAATIDTSAPAAPVVTITEDANDDGLINSAELSGAVDVSVALPGDAVAGDSITITDGTTPVTIVLTAGQITAGVVTTTFTAPASGSTLTVTAAVTDIAGNVGASGSDAATIDTSAPAAPVVTITEDANDDGLINSAELSGAVDVSVALPGDAVAGDSITITDGTTPVTIVLTAGQITAGVVTTTFTAPASGSTLTVTAAVTDIAGNVGASGSDAATIDTSAPAAPVVTITEDANDDGLINSAELSGAVDVSVALPGDAVAGDSITITDGTTPVTIVLTAGQITAGVVTTTFTAPASGSTLTVTAAVTDIAGNVGASGSDAATIDTSAPAAPVVTITEDANDDGLINSAELSGAVDVSVALPGDAVAGDSITITDGTTPVTIVLTAGQITAGVVTTTFTAPASGSTLTVTAAVTDIAGNVGASGSDAATIDTSAPAAPVVTITEDANDDGLINSAELSGAVDVSVALPGDAVAGDSITITDGTTPVTIVLTAGQITAGVVTTTFTAPASGSTLTVTAAVTDIAGNVGASGSDSALISITTPNITIDVIAGDDIINAIEDNSPVIISGATANVEDGQTVTVNVNGTDYFALVAANAWTLTVPAADVQLFDPSENVTANVTDAALNPAPQATRPITYDDSAPAAPVVTITEDANDDGLINSAELSGAVDVSVALPGDAVAGDSITITDGTTPVTIVLTAGQITAGVVTTTFTAPASGSTLTVTAAVTDIAGNVGASGSDAATIDTSAPAAPVVTITEDANDDGLINSAELSGAVDVSVALPGDAVAGDSITITDGTTPVTIVLTAGQITAGVVTTTFTAPASGSTLTVTAAVTDIAGNVGASGSDAATIDTSAPAAPVVTITEDANDDGLINSAELSGAVDVSVALPGDAVAGDSITITDGTTPVTIVLTAGQITAGVVTTTFTAPASGSTLTVTAAVTDIAGNVGASGSDAATIDTSAPAAPVVTITEDANDDGLINSAELSGAVDVSVALPGDAVAGDSITITDGTTPVTIVLTAGQITAGVVTTTFTAPASGSTLTVTAAVTDIAGNVGASGSDAATIDTSAPAAPVVTITEDANDDGLINSAELSGAVDVSVALPGDAVAGDSITITDGTTPVTIVLTAGQITAGVVTTTFTAPASGSTLTVTAAVTDIAGNVGASGSDAATIDTSAPAAPVVTITEDANDDGLINSAELSGAVDVSVALPGDAVAGDSITITDGTTPVTIVLTAGQITAGVVTTTFTAPASGSTLTVTAAVTDIAGNVGASGSDAATIDTSAPAAPVVTITEDANDDGLINSAELSGAVDVSVALPGDAVAGDSITITDGTTPVTIVLTAGQITAGVVTTTFTAPASGSTLTVTAAVTDIAGNVGASGSDAATIDTSAPAAPVVTITEDANDDGLINSAELSGAVDVSVALPGDAVAGDSITITDGTTPVTIVLTAGQITAGVVTTTFTAPASGSTLTVTAAVTDIAGNVGASGSDAATIDTSAPAAPVVTITEDANDDGLINSAELSGAVDVSVALPGDAVAGDSITITDGTTPVTIVLTAGQITAGVVTTTFTAPASGSTLTVTAAVTDIAGNVGASGSDAATIDTSAPAAPVVTITEDANDDGLINSAELSGAVDVSVALPGDAVAGDSITITDGTTPVTIVLTAGQITAGVVTTTFTAPASGSTLTVTAAVTDIAGNVGASGSDAATIDTTAPTLAAQTLNYAENQTAGATLATVVASDNLAVTGYSFTATGTNTSSDGFYQIDNSGNITITVTGAAANVNDFESAPNSTTHDVTAVDAAGNSTTATMTLNETNVEDVALNAVVDTITVTEDSISNVSPASLLANDVDDFGSSLTIAPAGVGSFTTAAGGTIVVASDGTYTYTPAANYSGADSYSYTVTNGAETDTGTLNITVTAVADTPNLTVDSVIDFVNAVPTAVATANTTAGISQANLESTLGIPAGTLDGFDPAAGVLNDPGNVNANDGGFTQQNLNLDAGQQFNVGWTFTNGEDTVSEITGGYNDFVLLAVTDPNGAITYQIITSSEFLGASTNGNGTFNYTSTVSGEHQFSWMVLNARDGGKDSSITVAAPVFVVDGNNHGQPIDIAIGAGVTDTDGSESLTVTITGLPTTGITFGSGIGTNLGGGTWTFTDAELDGLQLYPASGFTGTLNLSVTATSTESSNGDTATTSVETITINVTAPTNAIEGTNAGNTLNGTTGDDVISGFGGGDTINANNGNDLLYGGAGNDTLNGQAGNDTLNGQAGNDTLVGGTGRDNLVGGVGNDVMTGGNLGSDDLTTDTFVWNLGDEGTVATPAVDTINNFGTAAGADVLDLRDLLVGEDHSGESLDNYLHFEVSGGDTTIYVSTSGAFNNGNSTGAPTVDVSGNDVQQIVLTGVDITAGLGTDAEVINNLIAQQQIITD